MFRLQLGAPLNIAAALLSMFLAISGFIPSQKPGGKATSKYSVKITAPPPASLKPGPDDMGDIAGVATGPDVKSLKVVLYAKGGDMWWVQPLTASPMTDIESDGKWKNSTHGGTLYAALLVRSSYQPPDTTGSLPKVGGAILAISPTVPPGK